MLIFFVLFLLLLTYYYNIFSSTLMCDASFVLTNAILKTHLLCWEFRMMMLGDSCFSQLLLHACDVIWIRRIEAVRKLEPLDL
jgi:hypothetical protein